MSVFQQSKVMALLRSQWLKRLAQAAFLLALAYFIIHAFISGWSSAQRFPWRISWPALIVAYLFFIAQELSFAAIWRAILRRLDVHLPLFTAEYIYLTAELVRYIPGNVWHVASRVVYAEREGSPKTKTFISMTVELATKIAGAILFFMLTLPFWPRTNQLGAFSAYIRSIAAVLLIVGLPILLFGLRPQTMNNIFLYAGKLLKREIALVTMRFQDIVPVLLMWLASWLTVGIGFALALYAIGFTIKSWEIILVYMGIYAIGWAIGFLSFITPSGLGFREGTIALLLFASGAAPSLVIGAAAAVAAARVLPMLAEFTCVGAVQALKKFGFSTRNA